MCACHSTQRTTCNWQLSPPRDNSGSPDVVVAILQPPYFSCSTFSISEKCRHTLKPRYDRTNNKTVPEVLAMLQALDQGLGCR